MNPVTKHLTILLTDIKGFTDRTSHQTRAAIQALLDEHKALVQPILEGRGGKLVKTIGDAYLMTFESPTDAVLAGVAVQEALRARNAGRAEDDRIEVRIAINSGEVNVVEGDIFGEPVNITARLESVAEAGEVFFSEAVYLAMNKTEVPSSLVDEYRLKGIPELVKVYKVRRETPIGTGDVPPPVKAPLEPAPKAVAVGSVPHAEPPPAAAAPSAVVPAAAAAMSAACKKASLTRRALATLIDVVMVSIVVSHLFGSDAWSDDRAKQAAASDSSVQTDASGLHVKDGHDEVSIGLGGLHVKDGDGGRVDIDRGGVHVSDKGTARAPSSSFDEDDDHGSRARRHGPRFRPLMFAVFWFVMNLVFLKRWSATPGKKIMGLKVVKHADGGPLDKGDRTVRSAATLLSGYAAGLGYIWILFDKDGRGWHDHLAGTRVVAL